MKIYSDINDPEIVTRLKEINDCLSASYNKVCHAYGVYPYMEHSDVGPDEVRFAIKRHDSMYDLVRCLHPFNSDWHTYMLMIRGMAHEHARGFDLGRIAAATAAFNNTLAGMRVHHTVTHVISDVPTDCMGY